MKRLIPIVLLFLVACGASARTKTLQTGLFALNVTRDTVLEVSKKHEAQIIDACAPPDCTLDKGRAELAAWRSKVDLVIAALDKGYRLLASAALLSDAQSVSEAKAAVTSALALAGGLR